MITDRVLLVSSTVKGAELLQEMLGDMTNELVSTQSGAQARRELLEGEYALVVINTPLSDEFGHELATDAAVNTAAGVVMLIKAELCDDVAERVETQGVFCVAKPMMRVNLIRIVRQALASHTRLNALLLQKRALERRLEQQRLTDRAKFVLMERAGMTEAQAHRYLLKQAMDLRTTKESVAAQVLSHYEM